MDTSLGESEAAQIVGLSRAQTVGLSKALKIHQRPPLLGVAFYAVKRKLVDITSLGQGT